MQFSEDDLRSALQRKDPGPEFTQRVMARVAQQRVPKPANAKAGELSGWRLWLAGSSWRPVMAGAMAVVIFAVMAWMGIERYQAYIEQVQNRKVQEEKVARQAEEQAFRALRITSAKLNHVFQKVNGAPSTEPRIRRQTL
jgi:hypothetical protein